MYDYTDNIEELDVRSDMLKDRKKRDKKQFEEHPEWTDYFKSEKDQEQINVNELMTRKLLKEQHENDYTLSKYDSEFMEGFSSLNPNVEESLNNDRAYFNEIKLKKKVFK